MRARRSALTGLVLTIALLVGAVPGAAAETPVDEPIPGPIAEPTDEPVPGPVVNCRTIVPAPDVDLSGCDLSGADLRGADLRRANLADADLTGADLTDANLDGAEASGIDLSTAILWRTSLRGADLSEAVITDASIRGATFDGADLSDANLDGSGIRATSFASADLSNVDARRIDFTSVTLAGAILAGAELGAAILDDQVLSGLDLHGADLTGARLVRAHLVRTNLSNVDLTDATLLKADLSHSLQAGITWSNTVCPNGHVTTAAPCPASSRNEAGFLWIPSISYSFPRPGLIPDIRYDTTPANLFYSFQAADGDGMDAQDAPLFVMLNGGPGAATTANLMANNTAQYTLNTGSLPPNSPGFAPNPDSWTSMGNLLYIDPPLTGFSYNERAAAAKSIGIRAIEFFLNGNFNAFIDADQVLRGVLQFLDKHPDLQDNPVILVGESYGGVRVTTMLNMLLFSEKYGSKGSLFRDPGLVDAITTHFGDIGVTEPLTARVVARQFGRQVLIQPQLSSYQGPVQSELYWPDDPKLHSVIDDVATAAGQPGGFTRDTSRCKYGPVRYLDPGACAIMKYVPAFGRDRYNWSKPASWSDDQDEATAAQLTQLGKLNTILGFDVSTIKGFTADERAGLAYSTLGDRSWVLGASGVPAPPGVDAETWQEAVQELGAEQPGAGVSMALLGVTDPDRFLDDSPATVSEDSLEAHFGALGPADRYYGPWNEEIYAAFAFNILAPEFDKMPINPDKDPTFGDMFLQNIRYVQTFLTDADYDLVINSEALPLALARHKGVTGVYRESTSGSGSGQFVVFYTDGTQQRIYYPRYAESGHAVAASQPAKIRDDVATWMRCTQDRTCFAN